MDLAPDEIKTVSFDLSDSVFEWWNESTGTMAVWPGEFELMVGNSSDIRNLKSVKVTR